MTDQPSYGDRERDAAIFEAGRRQGLAEGSRQATEGWERKWAYLTPANVMIPLRDAEDAQSYQAWIAQQHALGLPAGVVHSRLVGPWETAEQPERRVSTGNRCRSKIAHESGAVRQCQRDHDPETQPWHEAGDATWLDHDDRVLLETPPAEQPEPFKILSYHYGPTGVDPDPGAMWCYRCGGRVSLFDGHAVCGCGAQLCESPADCGNDACPYRPATGGVVDPAAFAEPDPGCTLAIPPLPADRNPALDQPIALTVRYDLDGKDVPQLVRDGLKRRRHDPGELMEKPDLYGKPEDGGR